MKNGSLHLFKQSTKKGKFTYYKDKEILFFNFAGCKTEEFPEIINAGKYIIEKEPPQSLLTLADVSDCQFNKGTARLFQDFAVHNKPYMKAGALLGVTGLKKVIYDAIMAFSQRKSPLFPTKEKALEWLVEQ